VTDDQRDDDRMRRLMARSQPVSVPPFDALRPTPARSARRSIAVTLATVIVAVAALYAGQQLSAFRQQQASPTTGVAAPSATADGKPTASPKVVLPQPVPQPVTRTSAAAQVAWLGTSAPDGTAELIGVDPTGAIVARMPWAEGRPFRSADGMLIFDDGDRSGWDCLDLSLPSRFKGFYSPSPRRPAAEPYFHARWCAEGA